MIPLLIVLMLGLLEVLVDVDQVVAVLVLAALDELELLLPFRSTSLLLSLLFWLLSLLLDLPKNKNVQLFALRKLLQ
jgi:hypothetical protein